MIRLVRALLLLAALPVPATAQVVAPAVDALHAADAAKTAGLNAAVTQHNAAIAARNTAAEAGYQAELARFHEAQALNDRARADATAAADAYRASRAAYEADLARYHARANVRPASPATPRRPAPRPDARCDDAPRTGSHLSGRTCHD